MEATVKEWMTNNRELAIDTMNWKAVRDLKEDGLTLRDFSLAVIERNDIWLRYINHHDAYMELPGMVLGQKRFEYVCEEVAHAFYMNPERNARIAREAAAEHEEHIRRVTGYYFGGKAKFNNLR